MTGINITNFKLNRIENQKLIFASLLLNLFLICCIAGGAYKLFINHQAVKSGQNALRFAAENLNQEQQHDFKKTLRQARREVKPLLENANLARIEVRKRIAEPTFDRQAVEEALARTREADRAIRIKLEGALLNFAEKLSAEDRQKLADGLAKKGPLRQPPMMALKDD